MGVAFETWWATVPDLADPDPGARNRVHAWVTERVHAHATRGVDPAAALRPLARGDGAGPGHTGRLAACALVADWACYTAPVDRITVPRVAHAAGTFPHGLRVWVGRLADGSPMPVGYTWWHPIARAVLDRLAARPETVTDRGEAAPIADLGPQCKATGADLLILNASIVAPLRGPHGSHRLMRALADDLAAVPKTGLAAFTVSADGARFCRRFGMVHTGDARIDGVAEAVYVRRSIVPWW
jgi:hypothetical protein